MAEDSESGSASGPTDKERSDSAGEPEERAPPASDAAADDPDPDAEDDGGGPPPETDAVSPSEDGNVPDGSIEGFLDDGSAAPVDEQDERRSVSDAVSAPVADSEPDTEPGLEPDSSAGTTEDEDDAGGPPRTGREMRNSTAPRHRRVANEDESVVETDAAAASVTETDDESVVETDASAGVDAESASVDDPAQSVGDAATGPDLTAAGGDTADAVDEGLVGEGPASDEEMPLAAHIEEMVRRLAVVLVVGGVVGLAVFPVADQLVNFLWNSHIPGAEAITDRRPRLYGPLELVVTELKVAALAGFVVGLPVAVYETYLFMRPGLFPRERRYYLAAVPTSLVLALIGVAFAHFVVLPAIFAYFTAYTTGTAVVAFGLKETFSLILVLMGYMALVFQIPLFIMLAIMMNLTTRIWLEDRRLLFWGGFLGVAFLISPDPTGMAPIIVAATMITLFEGTLALLRWTGN